MRGLIFLAAVAVAETAVPAQDAITIQMPVGIVDLSPATSIGNVHWGEAWFAGNFQIAPSGLNSLTTTADPWANFRAVNHILMPSGRFADGTANGSNTPLTPVAPNYYQPWGDNGMGTTFDLDHLNKYQHSDFFMLEWPEMPDYEIWKQAAQAGGWYFSWNDAGTVLIHERAGAPVSPEEFLSCINMVDGVALGADGDSQILPDPVLVFVDTLNGEAPSAETANLCDLIAVSDDPFFFRGVIWIGGSLSIDAPGIDGLWLQNPFSVQGSGEGVEAQVDEVIVNGVVACAGRFALGRPGALYGSVLVGGGLPGPWFPEIWYDDRLRDGVSIPLVNGPSTGILLADLLIE